MKLTPYPHQLAGAKFLIDNYGGAIFAEPRSGKSKMVQIAIKVMQVTPTLIICPSSVMAGWYGALVQDEVNPKDIIILDGRYNGTVKKLRSLLVLNTPKYVIINYEKVESSNAFNIRKYALKALGLVDWKCIVLDESYRIASFDSNISKYIINQVKPVDQMRIIMTGTAICESPLDVVQPYIFLNGEFFGYSSSEDYRLANYNFFGFKWKPNSRIHTAKVETFVKNNSFQVKLADLGLGGEIFKGVAILPMSNVVENWYRWLATTSVYDKDGETMALTPAIKSMFAQKVSAGVNPLTNDCIDDSKAEWLYNLNVDNPRQTLVLSRFRKPLNYMEKYLTWRGVKVGVIHGDVKLGDREAIRVAFQNGELDMVLAQEDAVARGQDFSSLDLIVYHNNSLSYEVRAQSCLRGQNVKRTKPYEIIDVCIEGSVDEKVVNKLLVKQESVSQFIKDIDIELKREWGSNE